MSLEREDRNMLDQPNESTCETKRQRTHLPFYTLVFSAFAFINLFFQFLNMYKLLFLFRRLKISYSREFLLSLSGLEICKKLPSGIDESILR